MEKWNILDHRVSANVDVLKSTDVDVLKLKALLLSEQRLGITTDFREMLLFSDQKHAKSMRNQNQCWEGAFRLLAVLQQNQRA